MSCTRAPRRECCRDSSKGTKKLDEREENLLAIYYIYIIACLELNEFTQMATGQSYFLPNNTSLLWILYTSHRCFNVQVIIVSCWRRMNQSFRAQITLIVLITFNVPFYVISQAIRKTVKARLHLKGRAKTSTRARFYRIRSRKTCREIWQSA